MSEQDRGVTVKEAGRLGGQVRSARKTETARQNGEKGGRPVRPLTDFDCICGAGTGEDDHKALCPRGRAIKRRRARGTL